MCVKFGDLFDELVDHIVSWCDVRSALFLLGIVEPRNPMQRMHRTRWYLKHISIERAHCFQYVNRLPLTYFKDVLRVHMGLRTMLMKMQECRDRPDVWLLLTQQLLPIRQPILNSIDLSTSESSEWTEWSEPSEWEEDVHQVNGRPQVNAQLDNHPHHPQANGQRQDGQVDEMMFCAISFQQGNEPDVFNMHAGLQGLFDTSLGWWECQSSTLVPHSRVLLTCMIYILMRPPMPHCVRQLHSIVYV